MYFMSWFFCFFQMAEWLKGVLRSILLCLQHINPPVVPLRGLWDMTFSARKAPEIKKKTKTKNASGKSVVLEGTTEMCLFVRGQEGKKLKWLLPVGRVLHSARWKQRRQRRVPRITVTSHAAFRRRSKCGGVCFLQRGCLRCEKCTCGATASVGRNL